MRVKIQVNIAFPKAQGGRSGWEDELGCCQSPWILGIFKVVEG